MVKTDTSTFGIELMVKANQITPGNYQIVIIKGNSWIKMDVSETKIISNLWTDIYAFERNNLEYSWAGMLLRLPWQIDKHSLTLFLGPRFTSTSPLNIIKQLHSHTRTPRRILNNRKIEIYNFVLIFES